MITESPETIKPLDVEEGGRGSGKSRSIAQRLTLSSLKRKMRIGLVRKVFDTIRDSSYKEIKDVVEEWNLSNHFTFTKSPLGINVASGTEFICKGLDKPEKVKSLANVDLIWIEEATELSEEDWEVLSLSIRGNTKYGHPKQTILSFNRRLGNWTEKEFFKADGSFKTDTNIHHVHSTFLDNKFLDSFYIERFNKMKNEDPELYKKNALGMPVALKGLIFNNWDIVDAFPDSVDETIYGMDFGVSDPTVVQKIGINGLDIYIDELCYQRGLTNQRLIALLPELIPDKSSDIYADSEDKNRIEEIYDAGWKAVKPADKEPKSVIEGIAFMKGYQLHITRRSTSTIKDYENYKWKTDKYGNSVTPEAPMHAFSHGCDTTRYPMWTHLRGVEAAQSGMTPKEEQKTEVDNIPHRGMTFKYNPKAGKRHVHSF